jgi:hypothetical protein
VDVHAAAVVARAEWCARSEELVVLLARSRTSSSGRCAADIKREEGEGEQGGRPLEATTTVRADAAWLATGHHLDAALVVPLSIPLSTLRARRPRPLHDGLPELTSSLRWDEHTDLWVAGALAALQLGPDAFNLAGDR